MQAPVKVILGIDPGCLVAGFGVAKKELGTTTLIDHGFLKMRQQKPLHERVLEFHDFFEQKIKTHGVTELALETPFLGKSAQNFLKLGYLRGALYVLAARHQLVLHEFTPTQVKLSVTGYGGASKEQVATIIMRLFPRLYAPDKLDVTDALAVTLSGLWQNKYSQLLK